MHQASNLNKASLLQSFNIATIDTRTSVTSAWKYTLSSGKSRCKYLFHLIQLCTVQKPWSKITCFLRRNNEMPASRNQTIYNKSYLIKQLRKQKMYSITQHIRATQHRLYLNIHVEKKDEDLRKRRQRASLSLLRPVKELRVQLPQTR